MITRIWHGRTRPENATTYLNFLLEKGTADYKKTKGNRSAKIWKNAGGEACHFWTITEWDNLESVRAFAGEEFEKAKYYPEDDGMLLEFEERVLHYESYDVSNAKINTYLEQLEQAYCGGNWLAESFKGKLGELNEQKVFQAPAPGIHTVAELVWHCIYWRRALLERLRGNQRYRGETLNRLNFLPLDELRKKGWAEIMAELSEIQSSLVNFLQDKNDAFLENEYEPGSTFDYLLAGTIQHDIYHLGQIGLVLKMLAIGSPLS